MDGYVKIKAKIDDSGINKDIAKLEEKIKKLQEENLSSSKEEDNLQREITNYEQLCQKADSYKQKLKELNAEKNLMSKNNPELSVGIDTPAFANIKAQIAEINQKYAETVTQIDKQAPKIDKVYSKLEQVKKKQTENNQKIQQFKTEISKINTNHIQSGFENVGRSITNQISKLGKMSLAIFGIRSAYNLVSSAISTVSQYNDQVATDINYIKYALANTLLPVIQKIISFVYTLLSYINAITSAWFGINLFANSSAKTFQSMSQSASSTAKSAKEIKKSLQGFDEMNVLSDNSDSSSSGDSSSGSGGSIAPSMDLSALQADVPAWLQWIIDNKEIVIGALAGITAGLISMKLLGLDPLMSLGIGLIVGGIVALIQDVVNFIQDPSWDNFANILRDLAIILARCSYCNVSSKCS